MSFTPPPTTAPVSGGGSDYQAYLIPAGSHQARLVWLIVTGTVEDTFKNETKKKKKVTLGFELPTTLLPNDHPRKGEPCFISKTVVLHMGEKAGLRAFIEEWRGKRLTDTEASQYDFGKLLGQPAVLTIGHDTGVKDPSKVYANIKSIVSESAQRNLMPGFTVAPQANKSVYLSVDWLTTKEGAEYFMGIFNTLPKYTKEAIMKSDEWQVFTRQPFYIQPAGDAPVAPAQPQAPASTPAPQAQVQAEPRAEDVIDDSQLPF